LESKLPLDSCTISNNEDIAELELAITYLIVPFAYKGNYSLVRNGLDSAKEWKVDNVLNGQNRFFDHINELLEPKMSKRTSKKNQKDNNLNYGRIGKKYTLDRNTVFDDSFNEKERQLNYILKKPQNELSYIASEKCKYFLKIKKISIYIFETQIGFLTYEIEYCQKNLKIEDIIEGNYFIKKAYQETNAKNTFKPDILKNDMTVSGKDPKLVVGKINTIRYNKDLKSGDILKESISFLFSDINEFIFSRISNFQIDTYFEKGRSGDNQHKASNPKQYLMYTSVLFNKKIKDEKIKEYLLLLRRGFNSSHNTYAYEDENTNTKEVIKISQNIYWGISLEGFANISHKTGTAQNDSFFNGNGYSSMIKNEILFMYVLLLCQRYSLLYLDMQTLKLPDTLKGIVKNEFSSKPDVTIKKLKERIVMFNLKCNFEVISNIAHQDMLYRNVREKLEIDILNNSLKSKLENLLSMTSMIDSDKKDKVGVWIKFILFPLFLTTAIFEMGIVEIEPLISSKQSNLWLPIITLLILFCIGFSSYLKKL
jgi:hypothetical protein